MQMPNFIAIDDAADKSRAPLMRRFFAVVFLLLFSELKYPNLLVRVLLVSSDTKSESLILLSSISYTPE